MELGEEVREGKVEHESMEGVAPREGKRKEEVKLNTEWD
jgi:hypothetical protein